MLPERPERALHLARADAGFGVDDLAVDVGELDDIGVNEAERADAGAGEVQGGWGAEAAEADN
jgi:hypothetical protein